MQEAYRPPRSRCSLCPRSGGYPVPGPGGPHPDLVGGVPWVPPSRPGMGYPPPPRPGMGYSPPPSQTWDGVPPPDLTGYPPRCGLTNKLKTVPSPILRMRAVTTMKRHQFKILVDFSRSHLLVLIARWNYHRQQAKKPLSTSFVIYNDRIFEADERSQNYQCLPDHYSYILPLYKLSEHKCTSRRVE